VLDDINEKITELLTRYETGTQGQGAPDGRPTQGPLPGSRRARRAQSSSSAPSCGRGGARPAPMARLPALRCPLEHVDPGEQLSGSTGRSRHAATPCLVGGVAIQGAMRCQARPLVAVGQGPASHSNRQPLCRLRPRLLKSRGPCWLLIPSARGRCYVNCGGLDRTLSTQRFRSRPSTWIAPSNVTYPRSPRSHARYTTDFRICSSAQMSAIVSRRSSAITAIDGRGERSERVSPASVNGVHSVASAGKIASREGRGDARDSVGLTRVASTCRSSSGPCQGEGRRFEPGVPLQIIPDLRWLHAGVRVSCFRSARRRSPVL